jgi:putative restriction endonuclease
MTKSRESAMKLPRAWSLITVGDSQQYGGNQGYTDDPRRVYRYDSKVANHRSLSSGHFALIRNRNNLLGVAQIERIDSQPGKKTMLRCPACGTVNIKSRERKRPRFRCNNNHEFGDPTPEIVDVTKYEAHFEHTFVNAPDAIPVLQIKAAALRPSDQVSIEEIDLKKLERTLTLAFPETRAVLASFFHSGILNNDDAADDLVVDQESGTSSPGNTYANSMADTRASVLRSIKQRRGQKAFRDALMKRYGSRCVMTGCGLTDVLEAAHIWPYRGDDDNHPQNGLLLRADLHTLFDLDLIAIHPETFTIEIAPVLRGIDTYSVLRGRPLGVSSSAHPALEPLIRRWETFTRLHCVPAKIQQVAMPTHGQR